MTSDFVTPRRAAPTARSVAAEVLARVLKGGAFASASLDAELDRNVQLDVRDKALATELVYGTLRFRGVLEARIGKYASRGIDAIDPRVLAVLEVAAYQLLVLTRVPAFAAVNEAVSEVRALRGERVSAFANAILRRISGEPKPDAEALAKEAFEAVDPALSGAIVRAVGEEGARHLFFPDGAPPLGLRVEDARERDAWLDKLRAARPDATFEAGRVSPHAILARGTGRTFDLPGYAEGAWTPQEEGSQVVALALGARSGDVVLDACAGRGNKTGLLLGEVGASGAVDAADLHPKKLERLKEELSRIHCRPRATFAVDWSVGHGDAKGPYDRVLVDAPCSGTGTLRRRPEILLRRALSDADRLAVVQRAILKHAAQSLKTGGRLVYAVCSVLPQEAEDVVQDAPQLGLASVPFESEALRAVAQERTSLRLLPHVHGTDGYFLASFVRI